VLQTLDSTAASQKASLLVWQPHSLSFFFVSIFLFPFFIQEVQLVRIERVRCIYNKRNMTRVRGGVFFFITRRNLWRHVRGGRRTFSLFLLFW
jgi:hypothetical protein